MRSLTSALRLWHTVRHLKFVQIVGRVRFRLSRPTPDLRAAPALRSFLGIWCEPAHRRQSLFSPTKFNFLNDERDLSKHGFDDESLPKLWRYNLHYFDDLTAQHAPERSEWHRGFIEQWINENSPARGTGWEPYPTSLRIVNWIKWIRAGNEPSERMLNSLAVQTRWLAKRLEWHLLGNHLFINAKALLFAGLFFDGDEARAWCATAQRILRVQIPEQILADGGQFERSPMYHALALEDMLDLTNIMCAYPSVIDASCAATVAARVDGMRRFLAAMCHPDGEVSFFNDSAIGVAPPPTDLDAYAQRLGFPARALLEDGVIHFAESGYIRVQHGSMIAILDVGEIGPSYLPGHAHADTLSMELSINGERILTNSGTGEYGLSAERLRQRGTAAHNTVSIGAADSSEVWSGFRVARRAHPFGLSITESMTESSVEAGGVVRITCAHDGFRWLKGRPRHTRTWVFSLKSVEITDAITWSAGAQPSPSCIDRTPIAHWHCAVEIASSSTVSVSLQPRESSPITLTITGGELALARTTFHPEFGLIRYQPKILVAISGACITTRIVW